MCLGDLVHCEFWVTEGAASRGVNAPFVGSDDPTLAPYLHKLSLRFALPNNFWKRWRYRASARGYALYPHDVALPFALKPDSVGLFFLKTKCPYPKLSTAAAYLLADAARAHVVRLPPSSVDAYLNQATLYFKDKPRLCSEPGYVLVLGDWGALGLGFMFEREGVWVLQSLFPKRR